MDGVADGAAVDVVIVGGGIAGLTAALFSARSGHSTVLCDGLIGGQLLNIGKIEDYPGFGDGVAGYELCPIIQEQVADAGGELHMAAVQEVTQDEEAWQVVTEEGTFHARAVIIATGCGFKELDVPGAARLSGKGISHCATCDGPLWRGHMVGVVGGGDSALQEALELAEFADKVIIFHRESDFTAQRTYRDRVLKHPSIEVRFGTVIEEVRGQEVVEALHVMHTMTRSMRLVSLSAIFVYIGLEPHTEFLRGHPILDGAGRVETDAMMRTRLPGLLAAGTVRSGSEAQAAVSAGEGAAAAMTAGQYLTSRSWPAHDNSVSAYLPDGSSR